MVRMHSIAGDFHKHTEDEDDVKIKKGEKTPKRTVDEEEITKVDRNSSISVGLNGQWALNEAVPQVSVSEDNSEKGEENKSQRSPPKQEVGVSWPEKKPIDSYYVIEEKHLEIDHDEGVDKLKIIQKKHINETPERQKAVMTRMHTIAGDIHENVADEDDFKVKRGNKVPKRAVDEEEMKKMDRRPSMTVTLNDQWALSKAGQKMSVSVDNAENREGNKSQFLTEDELNQFLSSEVKEVIKSAIKEKEAERISPKKEVGTSWPEKKPIDSYYVIEEKHLEIDHDEGVDKLKIVQKKHVYETPERQKAVMTRMHTITGDIHENVADEDDFKVKRGKKVPKSAVDEEEIKKVDRRPSMVVGLSDQWALSEASRLNRQAGEKSIENDGLSRQEANSSEQAVTSNEEKFEQPVNVEMSENKDVKAGTKSVMKVKKGNLRNRWSHNESEVTAQNTKIAAKSNQKVVNEVKTTKAAEEEAVKTEEDPPKVNGHSGAEEEEEAAKKEEETSAEEKEVEFSWTGEAEKVSVRGDFNNWEELQLNKSEDGVFKGSLKLTAGDYMYKYFVDGEWQINDSQKCVDKEGDKHNAISVVPELSS
ncbi:uncharacterized protein LOC134848861 isoform X3 [Symsagittifera roscoffensis]|uniref:uncharacterized protein LOC134848861 isoform X3 n=1 Tax=Symsagittifera roscoffensis TaxID=84072 RepID=UPI00307BAD85